MILRAVRCRFRESSTVRGVARAYALAWTTTAAATLVVCACPPLAAAIRSALPRQGPHALSRDANVVLGLWLHNVTTCGWPLALAAITRPSRRLVVIATAAVVASVVVNAALVGVAVGAYGTRLVELLPHLPAEWLGLAAGAGPWLERPRGSARRRDVLTLLALAGGALAIAALLEVFVTPRA